MTFQPKQTVVVPIDFSSASMPALREALQLAKTSNAVRVIHVMPKLDAVSPGVVWGGVTDESRHKHVSTYMETFLSSHDIEGVQTDILIGDPGHEIAKYADDCKADLIVIATHGHHGMRRVMLGSVAERVIRHAHCSVMAVRRHDAN